MENFGIATVPVIMALAYFVGIACKSWDKFDDRHIPVVCGAVGIVLGIASMYLMPDYPAHDIVTAMAVGCVSGLAATGINQIIKQYSK